jgi:hypothetical protein
MEQLKEQCAHEGHCEVAHKLPRFIDWELAKEENFENPEDVETIGADLPQSYRFQSLTEEPEKRDEPVRTNGTRQFRHCLATGE